MNRAAYKARIAASKAAIDDELSRLVPNAKRDGLTPAEFVSVVRRALGVAITTEYAQELLGAKACRASRESSQ